MITDAVQIIGNVPGQNLDPLLLAKSQSRGSTGFIMVAYGFSSDEAVQQSATSAVGKSFYDLFFFKGSAIYECARLNPDLRFIVNDNTALRTFEMHKHDPSTSVSLFQASETDILRLRSTFYYEPCLKVQVEALTRNQVATLLTSSRCRHGIIECNEFTGKAPAIILSEIRSEDELLSYQTALRHGRLLLYDIEKNREIMKERYFSCETVPGEKPHTAMGKLPANQFVVPAGKSLRREFHISNKDGILEGARREKGGVVRTGKTGDGKDIQCMKNDRKERRRVKATTRTQRTSDSNAGDAEPPSSIHQNLQSESQYVRTFERLFRSFRHQVLEHCGNRSDDVITRAEKTVQVLCPDFDCHLLTHDTAASTLDVIQEVVREAPFMKRSKLRQAAITLISDLYNKQYSLLEEHHAIDKVEQAYYRLRK